MQLTNGLLKVKRLAKHLEKQYEIKDPSIVQIADDNYLMYASIGNSVTQTWFVGRFSAIHPTAEWQELEPVEFINVHGPQLCAPAVTYLNENGRSHFQMYIQTACFEDGGQIIYATSTDGRRFIGHPQPLVTKDDINQVDRPIVGIYDVGISEVKLADQELICMLYSGYRKVGCGDIYASYKNKGDDQAPWTRGERLIAQEDVPFHNHPDYEYFEWGLEGAKLLQLADDSFVIIGVCFMPKPDGFLGTRQRVFMAASSHLNGPYQPIGFPFIPTHPASQTGENGHPDTLIEGDTLWVLYQERFGDGQPWHLRYASFNLPMLETFMRSKLAGTELKASAAAQNVEAYHFNYAA